MRRWATTRTRRKFYSALAIVATASAAGVVALSGSAVAAGPIYPVMNTNEYPPDGVYFRTAPDWNQTQRTAGLGVYAGDRVELGCWQNGTNVPRRDGGSNTVWYRAKNVTRSIAAGQSNQGWINAHFVNDGTGPNQVAPGVPSCNVGTPPVATPPPVVAPSPVFTAGCYNGLKWQKQTLTWSYAGAQRYLGNAYQAAANWNSAGANLSLTLARPGQRPDILIRDYYQPNGDFGRTGILGGRVSNTPPTQPLKQATPIIIELNQWALDSPKLKKKDKNYEDFIRTYTATHEMGHALGLGHPSSCNATPSRSIMRDGGQYLYTNPPSYNTPQDFDRRELKALFGG